MSQSLDARPDIVSKSTVIVSHPAVVLVCQVRKLLVALSGRSVLGETIMSACFIPPAHCQVIVLATVLVDTGPIGVLANITTR